MPVLPQRRNEKINPKDEQGLDQAPPLQREIRKKLDKLLPKHIGTVSDAIQYANDLLQWQDECKADDKLSSCPVPRKAG